MIIYRHGTKDAWIYKDAKGVEIKDKKIKEYISSLPPIPPAYKDVEIFYEKSPKILFQGLDDKDRLQQIYSPKWRAKADKEKFKALIEFGKYLPQMMLKMIELIKSPGHSKNKCIAIILRITSLCGFRIGQLKYQKLYGSTGLSTLMKKHLKFTKKGLEIKFIGKKGVVNECIVEDILLIDEIKKLTVGKKPGDFLFLYDDPISQEIKLINAIDVNNWLKAYNPDFTTKYFRTFDVNTLMIDELKETNPIEMTASQRKKQIVTLIKDISCQINNTPAICKKSYLNPDLIKMYIDHPRKYKKQLIDNDFTSRINFIKFLEMTHK